MTITVLALWAASLCFVGYFCYGLGGRDEARRQLENLQDGLAAREAQRQGEYVSLDEVLNTTTASVEGDGGSNPRG